ncbi:beta-ketoacyl-[acyl-carrier-protein] synthase family protein (plasmid) [Photobacterium sp. GJ3]|uniref:beta-ketoacyl-[acyl-carrier-protein] synthase family protein n=1 Tax=Photobacterium sp. GJ3 TaxID=2829502 RepID=UPI001B8CBBE8|nr:beta-ketoacyl-[acyl-carrier-protein] synthase family protein [Photobacterium sp. GJ3]QUJ70214.1 beta-ketoacyl-[acyl-carrier-protein] synthase family protein [Photobacterium sp. GJ3]
MKRVVITGLSVVSPLGCDKEQFWQRLTRGESGIDTLTKLDASLYPRPLAAEVSGWDTTPESQDQSLRPFGQAVAYTVAASRMALADAGFSQLAPDNDYGVIVGTTMGNQDIVERAIDQYHLTEDSPASTISGQELDYFSPSLLSAEIMQRFGFQGSSMTLANACAAGNYSVGLAFDRIRSGRNQMILAGGADPFSRTCYTIFHRLNASTAETCRPFDKARDGMVVGEGAAMLVLEEYEHAIARGAKIYAEVKGYALTCDAHHATAPHPEGEGAVMAMQQALAMASLKPKDIDYVSAHGTGTSANDISEAIAMHSVFGDALKQTPVSSVKSMLGHCMGAASAIEAVVCALALERQTLPPTMNTSEIDPAFPVAFDVIPGESRQAQVNHILSNAFAFGGNVSSVIFSKLEEGVQS